MKRTLLLVILFHCLFVSSGWAAFGIKPDGHLDMPALRKAYMESDFDKVQASLESFLKKRSQDATREEKIFAHMYLGVICAADSNSEGKAESHFNMALQLSPHIEPVDMFVPQKIQDMFDRIKRDFQKREDYVQNYDAFGNPIHGKDSIQVRPGNTGRGPAVSDRRGHAWVWWTLGSAAMVGAGIGAYVMLSDEKDAVTHST